MTTSADGRGVLSLTLSAFVVLAAEPLFLLVDTAVVGHLGSTQLAGLGVAGAVMAVLAVVGTSSSTAPPAARRGGSGPDASTTR